MLCSSRTLLKKGQINLIFIIFKIFVISFLQTWGNSWSLSCTAGAGAGAATFFMAPALAKKGGSGSTTLLLSLLITNEQNIIKMSNLIHMAFV